MIVMIVIVIKVYNHKAEEVRDLLHKYII